MKNIILSLVAISFAQHLFSQQVNSEQTYPKTIEYISIVHPIITIDKNASSFNFSNSYTIGFPVGINILKNDKIGFSFEIAPSIKVENGNDKVNNLLFHPGIMFRYKNGFTFITRLAFETNGRYGLTPVFNKIIIKKKNVNYFLAVPLPVRFGNDKPASINIGLQVGITF